MRDRGVRLHVESLCVRLGDRLVLDGVNLDVGSGELVGLIGPNGAGKTTLLRAILGLLRPSSGRIELEGATAPRARSTIGYVPQRHEFAWDFPITVKEAVMTGRTHAIGWLRRPSKEDHQAVSEAMERAGITHLRDRPLGELSGGQHQRVLVARALSLRSAFLLLDEPFTGVDVPTQEMLSDLLGQLRRDGLALIMTTHDIASSSRICTRVALINGRIIADGSPDELKDPEIWLRAFGVTSSEHLLAQAGAHS